MSKDTKTYIESCDVCQKSKRHFHAHRAPLHPLPIVDTFHRVHMDFLGPLPTSSAGHKHILLIVDSFSKWPEAFPLKTTDAATVARVFYDQYICRYGAPKSILTDRGQNFMSNLLKELCEIFQITKISTSSYHPQTNSTCERMNSYILRGLRAHCNSDQTNWHEVLQSIMLAYRTTRLPSQLNILLTCFSLVVNVNYQLMLHFQVNLSLLLQEMSIYKRSLTISK